MSITVYYKNDAALLELMTDDDVAAFEPWWREMERLMDELGRPYGDGPLSKITGIKCWHNSYRDGMSPQEALNKDMGYWE